MMYSKHFCIDCKNNWDMVPYQKKSICPSCKSKNTRHFKTGDPTDKSEAVFEPAPTKEKLNG